MKLWAISDLHLRHEENRRALASLPAYPGDWLALAGDMGESEVHLRYALEHLTDRFEQLLWTPGNHDLWTAPSDPLSLRGEAKYRRLVEVCRQYGVLTPEDPYPLWNGDGGPCLLAPLFLLYDYSFRPDDVAAHQVLDWAAEEGILCTDEALLHADPFRSKAEWCAARCAATERRLATAAARAPLVLVTHWPPRRDLLRLARIPRFSPWCGTRRTEDWHRRFRALAVVYGHLHVRGSHRRDGVRFEEVSLGYPRNWDPQRDLASYLRQILPAPATEDDEWDEFLGGAGEVEERTAEPQQQSRDGGGNEKARQSTTK